MAGTALFASSSLRVFLFLLIVFLLVGFFLFSPPLASLEKIQITREKENSQNQRTPEKELESLIQSLKEERAAAKSSIPRPSSSSSPRPSKAAAPSPPSSIIDSPASPFFSGLFNEISCPSNSKPFDFHNPFPHMCQSDYPQKAEKYINEFLWNSQRRIQEKIQNRKDYICPNKKKKNHDNDEEKSIDSTTIYIQSYANIDFLGPFFPILIDRLSECPRKCHFTVSRNLDFPHHQKKNENEKNQVIIPHILLFTPWELVEPSIQQRWENSSWPGNSILSSQLGLEPSGGFGILNPLHDPSGLWNYTELLISYSLESHIMINYFYGLVEGCADGWIPPKDLKDNGWSWMAERCISKPPTREEFLAKRRDALASSFITHCAPHHRQSLFRALQAEGIPLHHYGPCLNNAREPSRSVDSKLKISQQYPFMLAMENTIQMDYVTEKYWQGFRTNSLMIYMGAPNIEKYSPTSGGKKKSFINVLEYSSVKELADYLRYLLENPDQYMEYFSWRSQWPQVSIENPLWPRLARDNLIPPTGKHSFICRMCEEYHHLACGNDDEEEEEEEENQRNG